MPARAPPAEEEEEEVEEQQQQLDISRVLVTQRDGEDYQLRVYIPNSSSRETLRAIVKELGGKAHTKTAKAADYAVVDPKASKLATLWEAIHTDKEECRIVDVAWLLRCKQKGRRLRYEKYAIAQPEVKPRAPFTDKYKDTKTLYNDAVDLPLMARYLVREKKDERGASSINTWEAFVRRYPNNGHTAQSWKQKYKVNKQEVDRLAKKYRRTVDKRRDRGEDPYTADEADEDEALSDNHQQVQQEEDDNNSSDQSDRASDDAMPIKKGKTAKPSRKSKERQSDAGPRAAVPVASPKLISGEQQGGRGAASAAAAPGRAAQNAPTRQKVQTGFIEEEIEEKDDDEVEGETEDNRAPVASTSRLAATSGRRRTSSGAAGQNSRSPSGSGSSARPIRPPDNDVLNADSMHARRPPSHHLDDNEMRDEPDEQDYDEIDREGRSRSTSTQQSQLERGPSAPRASASVRRGVTTDLGSSGGRVRRPDGVPRETAAQGPVQREEHGEAAEDGEAEEDGEEFVLPPPLSATAVERLTADRLANQRDVGKASGEAVATRKRKRSSVGQMETTGDAGAQSISDQQREYKKRRTENASSVSQMRSSDEPLRPFSESTTAKQPISREVSTASGRSVLIEPIDTRTKPFSTPADFGLDAISGLPVATSRVERDRDRSRSASAFGSEADAMDAGALAEGSRRRQTRSASGAQKRQDGGEPDAGEAMTGREGRGGTASTARAQTNASARDARHDKGKGREVSALRSPDRERVASRQQRLLPRAPAALRTGPRILSDGLTRHDEWTADRVDAQLHFSESQLDDMEFLMNGDRAAARSFANLLGSGKQSGGGRGLTRAQLEEWARLRKVMWTPEHDIEVLDCVKTGVKRVGPHNEKEVMERMKFLGAHARQHGPGAVERRRFPFEK